MITVTLKDMLEFIFAQPNKGKVNFSQTSSSSSCGCVMVQYARHKNIKFEYAGSRVWWDNNQENCIAKLEDGIYFGDFIPKITVCTYKQIKVMLKEKFPEETKEFAV